MSGFLDTSIVVRYLTGSPPELAEKAARIIDSDEELLISGVALAETAYVLTSVYGTSRTEVVDAIIAFMQKQNVRPWEFDKATVLQALLLCRPSNRVSFSDAMLWAAAYSTESRVVYSFDVRFPGDGLSVRQTLARS